ncbi:MAG: hypothetical protein IPJ65_21235 [Archangiaceae bacterium]|nr:hypothetical protein [Archangiaceae bacterium]
MLLLVAGGALAQPRVEVATELDSCGLAALTRAALKRNGVEQPGWLLDLRVREGQVRLTLSDADTTLLERSLPGGQECRGLAEAAALIVERFARQLSAPSLAPKEPGKPKEVPPRETPPRETPPRETPPPPPRETPPPREVRPPALRGVRATPPPVAPPPPGPPPAAPPLVEAPAAPTPSPQPSPPPGEREGTLELIDRVGAQPSATAPPAAPAAVAAPAPAASASRSTFSLDLKVTHWDAGAELLGLYGIGDRFRPALAVVASALINDRWRVGLRGWASLPETDAVQINAVTRGTITAEHFLATARAGPCFRFGTRWRLCAEASAGARFTWATAQGVYLYRETTGWLASPALGASAQLTFRPVRWLELSLTPGASFSLLPRQFQIDDTLQRARLSPVDLFVALSVAVAGDR